MCNIEINVIDVQEDVVELEEEVERENCKSKWSIFIGVYWRENEREMI